MGPSSVAQACSMRLATSIVRARCPNSELARSPPFRTRRNSNEHSSQKVTERRTTRSERANVETCSICRLYSPVKNVKRVKVALIDADGPRPHYVGTLASIANVETANRPTSAIPVCPQRTAQHVFVLRSQKEVPRSRKPGSTAFNQPTCTT